MLKPLGANAVCIPIHSHAWVRKGGPLVDVGKYLETRTVKGLKWVIHSISFCCLENSGGRIYTQRPSGQPKNNSIAICNPVELVSALDG
jgi:hypothetical protein